MKKILSIFGTRPEAIKMAPVVKQLQRHPDLFDRRVCVTAQHRQVLSQVLRTDKKIIERNDEEFCERKSFAHFGILIHHEVFAIP